MKLSLFEHLVKRHPMTTEVLFDNTITTNGKGLDSRDLVIIYDLTMFEKESQREEFDNGTNDIAVLSILDDIDADDLIQHPTCEDFSFCWTLLKAIIFGFFQPSFC